MAIDITKTYSNVRKTILENRNVNVTPRSVVDDMLLIPMSTELAKQEILMQYINALQSFSSISELINSPSKLQIIADALDTTVETVKSNISTALEQLANNYGKSRKQATAATGIVSFWRQTPVSSDEENKSIPVGTVVASASTGIQYRTTQEIFFNNYYADINFGTDGYMLDVPVECVVTGSIGNTVIGDITICINAVTGFPNVTNKVEFANGTDTELDLDFAARMQYEISGNNVGTVNGIKSVVLQKTNATSLSVITAGNELMAPSRRDGGCLDIYVKGSTITSTEEDLVLTGPTNVITLDDSYPKPVTPNTAYLVNSQGVTVTVLNDTTSIYAGTQKAYDKLVFSNTLQAGSYKIQYSYNKIIKDINDLLQSDEYNTGANIIVKEAVKVPVDIFLQVVSYSTDADEKSALVDTLITTIKSYLSTMKIGEQLEQSDIINLCYIDGINRVVLPLTYFKKTADISPAVNDVIAVNNTQYITLGNLSITI